MKYNISVKFSIIKQIFYVFDWRIFGRENIFCVKNLRYNFFFLKIYKNTFFLY